MLIGFGISPSRVKVTGGAVAFDADAEAFFTAASITDATQKSAVNQLVLDLKSYNIWTKMTALYPIVGGSASSHAVNLKTPGTFNLNFSTGWTHSSTGATPNGSAYANTFFNPVTQSLTYNNNHLSYYSRTSAATSTSFYEIGSGNNSQGGTALSLYRNDTTGYYDSGTATANRLAISGLNGLGFFVGSSITTNVGKYFRNGSQLQSKNPLTNVSMQSYNFYLGAFNEQDTNTYYSNKQCAFASIGTGLTDTEASNFYTAVQAYQTTLSRNV